MCRGGEIECPGFPERAVETKICEIQKCTSGSELVKNVANELRTNLNVDDRKVSFLLEYGPYYMGGYYITSPRQLRIIGSHISPSLVKITKSLFLNRYAQSVTLNGEIINDENHEEIGYGIWVG